MHSRKDSEQDDPEDSAGWGLANHNDQLDTELVANGEPRSWKSACAARRSIERMQEQRRLKAWLSDVFDDSSEDIDLDYYDPSDDED